MSGDRYTIQLPPDLESAALARIFVIEHAQYLPPTCLDDALICVSELVSNAVLHGRPDITLELRTDPPGIGVAVTDLGPDLPAPGSNQPDTSNPHGRGLLIVAALAEAWGVRRSSPDGNHGRSDTAVGVDGADGADTAGKTIWFELRP